MEKTAIFIAIFMGVFVAFAASFLPLILSGTQAAQESARARRIAEARLNARLLRFNL